MANSVKDSGPLSSADQDIWNRETKQTTKKKRQHNTNGTLHLNTHDFITVSEKKKEDRKAEGNDKSCYDFSHFPSCTAQDRRHVPATTDKHEDQLKLQLKKRKAGFDDKHTCCMLNSPSSHSCLYLLGRVSTSRMSSIVTCFGRTSNKEVKYIIMDFLSGSCTATSASKKDKTWGKINEDNFLNHYIDHR